LAVGKNAYAEMMREKQPIEPPKEAKRRWVGQIPPDSRLTASFE
jgi:hypothetical protein